MDNTELTEPHTLTELYTRPADATGRPNGSRRPASLDSKYPIKWKAYYDPWLVEYLRGVPIKEIAKHYNFSHVQIGNVINSPAAKKRLSEIGKKILDAGVENVIQESLRINAIKDKSLERMEQFLDNNDYQAASPFSFIDRVVKIKNSLTDKPSVQVNTNIDNSQKTLVISAEAANNISRALELSRDL